MRAPPVPEWTVRAAATGILLGLVFGAANAYLGLRVGLTITASIPAAVMTVAIFRLVGARGSILEANLSQTIGSASTSLASGTIFTIPALFLWGMAPPYLQVAALCFLGGVLGLSAMIPLRPETSKLVAQMSTGELWSRYVRYIGAGAVAVAGVITVLRNLPTMASAFGAVLAGLRTVAPPAAQAASAVRIPGRVENPEADTDLPGSFVAVAIAVVVLVCAFVPGVFSGSLTFGQRAVCAAGAGIFGLLFVAVAARIVGIVGVTSQPTSGIALVTLLGIATVFAAAGWTSLGDRAAVLTVGTVVAVAASKAGDISQDLKTGWLVGATPLRQQLGQLIGAAFACWVVAATVLLLGNAYTFGSRELPAPQATLMKTIVEGVLAGALPWGLVLTGGGLAIAAILCGVSGLAFAIGVYLPLSSMTPIFVGGCVRAAAERGGTPVQEREADGGILAASGLVAGEGLAGILVAALIAVRAVPRSIPARLPGLVGEAGTLLVIGLLCIFLARARRQRRS